MLIGEVIQRVQSLYSKGVESDDTRLTSRNIYSKMITVRAKLLQQKSNKKQVISQWDYQTLQCVELVVAPVYECPCLPSLGCETLKTKYKIPTPLFNYNGSLIQSVTSLEGSVVFSYIGWVEKKHKSSNKYTSNKPDYYIRGSHLYITHKSGLKSISITGLFEDPLDAYNFTNQCVDLNPCTSLFDLEFPLNDGLVDTLVEMTTNELIKTFQNTVEDITNNNLDSPVKQSK